MVRALNDLIAVHGQPTAVGVDNGPNLQRYFFTATTAWHSATDGTSPTVKYCRKETNRHTALLRQLVNGMLLFS